MDRIAEYRFIKLISEGAQGKLFQASGPGGFFAVRVLPPTLDANGALRLVDRLRSIARLRFPGLMSPTMAGAESGRFFYALRFTNQATLLDESRTTTRRKGRLDEEPRSRLLIALSAAARCAHRLHDYGVAHRNLKPSNLFIDDAAAPIDDSSQLSEVIVLSEPGLAHVVVPGRTLVDVSSLAYVDPSTLRGGAASRSTDIWSLGMSLHLALTGRSTFGDLSAKDPPLAVRRVLSSPPVLSESLSDTEAEVLRLCLDPNLSNRFQTASDLALAIDQLRSPQ